MSASTGVHEAQGEALPLGLQEGFPTVPSGCLQEKSSSQCARQRPQAVAWGTAEEAAQMGRCCSLVSALLGAWTGRCHSAALPPPIQNIIHKRLDAVIPDALPSGITHYTADCQETAIQRADSQALSRRVTRPGL